MPNVLDSAITQNTRKQPVPEHRLIIEPKTVIIKNPPINYGVAREPFPKYIGYARSFERRVRFGKELPIPWFKPYECRAADAQMAEQLLAKLAQRDGYSLGGIHDIHIKEPGE